MSKALSVFFFLFVKVSLASEPSLGKCPDLRGAGDFKEKIFCQIRPVGIRNFTVESYTGRWFEYSKLFLIPEAFGNF